MSKIVTALFMPLLLIGCAQPNLENETDNETVDREQKIVSQNAQLRMSVEDYREFLKWMPDDALVQYVNDSTQLRELALDVHSVHHIQQEAIRSGVDQIDKIKHEIKEAKRKILIGAYIDEKLKGVKPIEDDDVLRDRYVALSDRLKTPEKRKFSHILVANKKPLCECEDNEKLTVKQIHKKVLEGADFSTMAEKYSDDQASAKNGGQIDSWITSETKIEPEFYEAGFRLEKVGDISSPIQTSVGKHIIRLDAIEPSRLPPFEEVRKTVQATVFQKQRGSVIDEIKASSYPDLDSLNIEILQDLLKKEYDKRFTSNEK